MKHLSHLAIKICLTLLFCGIVTACGGGMDRVKFGKALSANDIDLFKTEVTRIQTDPGYTPKNRADGLYDAFLMASKRNMEATTFILDQGVPIDYPTNQPTSTRRGAVLRGAIEANKPEIVSLLLERGADPNIKLWTPGPDDNLLFVSTMHKDLIIVRILLEAGANPNLWRNPFYPSLIAFYGRRPDIQNLLKEYGGVEDPTLEQRAGLVKKQTTPKAAATPVPAKQNATDKTIEGRLQIILALKEQGVISAEEYSEARNKILGDL